MQHHAASISESSKIRAIRGCPGADGLRTAQIPPAPQLIVFKLAALLSSLQGAGPQRSPRGVQVCTIRCATCNHTRDPCNRAALSGHPQPRANTMKTRVQAAASGGWGRVHGPRPLGDSRGILALRTTVSRERRLQALKARSPLSPS